MNKSKQLPFCSNSSTLERSYPFVSELFESVLNDRNKILLPKRILLDLLSNSNTDQTNGPYVVSILQLHDWKNLM